MTQSEKPDYRLVYDGDGGLRMAPANTVDREPEPHIAWNPDGEARLEPRIERLAPPPPPPDRRPMFIAGVLLLGLVGIGAGLALRLPPPPALGHPAPSPAGQMEVQVKPDAPPPRLAMVRTPEKLDVFSPEAARQARAAAPAAPMVAPSDDAAPLPVTPPPPPRYAAIPEPAPPMVRPAPPTPRDYAPAVEAPPVRQALRGPDCASARTRAEVMVCNDPGLAAADRRMARAYRGAARSGAPLGQLRAEQDDWLDLREDAAHISRRAVAQLYAQRIDELEAMADPQ